MNTEIDDIRGRLDQLICQGHDEHGLREKYYVDDIRSLLGALDEKENELAELKMDGCKPVSKLQNGIIEKLTT